MHAQYPLSARQGVPLLTKALECPDVHFVEMLS